nr:transposase [Paenibacillus sp. GP183]
MVRIFSKLEDLQSMYETVCRWAKPISHIAEALEPEADKTSQTAEWEMAQVLEWLKQTYTEENDATMVENVIRYSRGFWKGLFTCYDHYYIPRTNNDLEQFFRQTKACHRRITGLRNWNSYIIRNGEMIVLVNDSFRQKHVIALLQKVSYKAYAERKLQWNNRLSEGVQRRRFNRDPQAFLQHLENQWDRVVVR